jgi:hypothetical protein
MTILLFRDHEALPALRKEPEQEDGTPIGWRQVNKLYDGPTLHFFWPFLLCHLPPPRPFDLVLDWWFNFPREQDRLSQIAFSICQTIDANVG